MTTYRNYGIDLLRLVLMYMVCVLHTLGQGGVLYANHYGTGGYYVFWFQEVFCYCAVDGFALISGYIASEKPRKLKKLRDMWIQAVFYSFVVTLIFTLVGVNKGWGVWDMIQCLMPVTFEKFWYFTAYFLLLLVMPVLNKFLFSLDEKTSKKVFFLCVALFSLMGTVGSIGGKDPFKLEGGYSALWLIALYCMGALAKRGNVFEESPSWVLILIWAGCILLTWANQVFAGSYLLTNYISPTVLFSGLMMVVLFSRIKVKGTMIRKVTPYVFGIYLFQLSQVIWDDLLKDAFVSIVEKPLALGVLLVLVYALGIFLAGLGVEFIRSLLEKGILACARIGDRHQP